MSTSLPAISTRISGPRRTAIRLVWAVMVLLTLGYYALIVPDFVKALQTASLVDLVTPASLPDGALALLAELGLSLAAYARIVVGINSGVLVISTLIALALFALRSDDWMAILVSYFVILFAALNMPSSIQLQPENAIMLWVGHVLNGFVWVLFVAFMFLFPDGRLTPRRLQPAAVGLVIFSMVLNTFPDQILSLVDGSPVATAVLGLLILSTWLVGAYAQFYRFRRVADPAQRRQIKWVVYGVGVLLIVGLISSLPGFIYSRSESISRAAAIWLVVSVLLTPLYGVILAAALGIAMLRSNLWDIDIIIRRTLTYAASTVVLGTVYFGGVVGLQSIFETMAGERSPLALVASTLLIAALFAPIRRRVQALVDRRFNRSHYDAAHTLDAFAAGLYHEVDIANLEDSLVRVVDQTMQPEFVSLWVTDSSAARQKAP